MTVKAGSRLVSAGYLALVRGFPPRPIRSEDKHRRAIAVVNGLLDRPTLNRDEEDYLDVLGLLIADYEDSIYEHPDFNPIERLRHLMEEHSLTQAALARLAGVAVTSLSDILNGKRRISPRIPREVCGVLWGFRLVFCVKIAASGLAAPAGNPRFGGKKIKNACFVVPFRKSVESALVVRHVSSSSRCCLLERVVSGILTNV